MYIFSPFPRVLSYESPKATMQTKHQMVCTFKKIKNVHQLLIINPKRYIYCCIATKRRTCNVIACASGVGFFRPKSEIPKTRARTRGERR